MFLHMVLPRLMKKEVVDMRISQRWIPDICVVNIECCYSVQIVKQLYQTLNS